MRGKLVNKYINATYQEIYDIATSPNKVSIIGIRTPSGSVPSTMLSGLWKQFKSVKYNGADFVMRPTARQPLDPLQIGSEAGSQMDMRDVQNPIIFRGCHGESLGTILNELMARGGFNHTFSGDSLDIDEDAIGSVENFYYQCLTDMSWKKSMPENGFAFNGLHPLVYNLATNYQVNDNGIETVVPTKAGDYFQAPGAPVGVDFDADTKVAVFSAGVSPEHPQFNAGRRMFSTDLIPMGWFDTENRIGGNDSNPSPNAHIPRAYMGILMLPPAYSSGIRMFYRIVITHYFTFKDFRSISLDSDYSSTPGYYDAINTSKDMDVRLTSASVR